RETGSPQAISAALNGLAKIADMQGDFPTAQAYAHESLSVAEKVGSQQGMAIAQNRLGRIARQLGNYYEARALHEKSMALARSIKNVPITALTMNRLGEIAADEGDYESATRYYLEALPIHREMKDPYYIADNLCYLAEAALKMHEQSQAFIYMNEALALAWQIQAVVLSLQILTCYARLYVAKAWFTHAAELWGFLTGYSALLAQVARTVQALAPDLEAQLSPEAFRIAVERGKALPLETIVDELLGNP
ncbi:MAG: tetratricopeptide repeat protein, partial [Chloroflexota bacterium]